jgi:hypothetical protein
MKPATLRWFTPTAVVIVAIVATLLMLALTSCAAVHTIPATVMVPIEKFKPLPAWATDPLVKPAPADGTVGAHLKSEAERGAVIDYANCVRKLLKALDDNAGVDAKACRQ